MKTFRELTEMWKADPLTHEVLTAHTTHGTGAYHSEKPVSGLHDDLKSIGWKTFDTHPEHLDGVETARTTDYFHQNGNTLRVREIHNHDPHTDWAVHVYGENPK